MAYHRNWRKRHAEVLSLAADDSNSSDTDGLLRAQFSEDETASLSPADGNISDYDSDALVLSSDTDSEVADNLCDDSAEETAPDLGLMMWVRAVWKEPNGEEEGVIPEVWVKDNMVHWPPGANVTKAAKEMRTPASSWKMFPLLKIKFKSNNQEVCETFDQTSTAELSEEECGPVKRVSKKKNYPGFILGTE
ncbi:putative verprolin-like [Triplophysa rosa]|uniref:Verprolin-like n=1 Tax=Triplophysa rosa TaxID=992332 RepID=A0A9W7TAF8_TRIRA|nr:putative verprolin-like [Triplophysa rosa]